MNTCESHGYHSHEKIAVPMYVCTCMWMYVYGCMYVCMYVCGAHFGSPQVHACTYDLPYIIISGNIPLCPWYHHERSLSDTWSHSLPNQMLHIDYREFQVGCPGVIAHAQTIPSTSVDLQLFARMQLSVNCVVSATPFYYLWWQLLLLHTVFGSDLRLESCLGLELPLYSVLKRPNRVNRPGKWLWPHWLWPVPSLNFHAPLSAKYWSKLLKATPVARRQTGRPLLFEISIHPK